jgi:hypothetical protein
VIPRELFAVERLHLKPLPAWIPEVYYRRRPTIITAILIFDEWPNFLSNRPSGL